MTPEPDWDAIDDAVDAMAAQGLRDVRANKEAVHTVLIEFSHDPGPWWMEDDAAFDSFAELNMAENVIGYTFRFPGVRGVPQAPDADELEVALTRAAQPLPAGREVDIVGRQLNTPDQALAPHIRGRDTEYIPLAECAEIAPQVQQTYYEAVAGELESV